MFFDLLASGIGVPRKRGDRPGKHMMKTREQVVPPQARG